MTDAMLDQFVAFCLHRRVAVIILAALLAAYGVYAWETLSVEAYPELATWRRRSPLKFRDLPPRKWNS